MTDSVRSLSVIEGIPEENTFVSSQADLLEEETRCGIGPFKPAWLQPLASKKTYAIMYGLIGTAELALGSYFVATITTLEKRFKIPSQMSGWFSSAIDIGTLLTSLVVAYIGSAGHKPRWLALGTFILAVSIYMRLIPHWLYGPGEDALAVTEEFGNINLLTGVSSNDSSKSSVDTVMSLCGNNHTHNEDCDNASSGHTSSAIFFMAQLVQGVANAAYMSLGIAYMDDNSLKNKTPMLIAISQCVRMVGPTFGYLLASYALEMFIAPDLTPTIDNTDPRWLGAWWYGWNPLGIVMIMIALTVAMFPRSLPRAMQRNIEAAAAKGETYVPKQPERRSLEDFKNVMSRMLKNKIMMCNSISTVFFMFGEIGLWVFLPKYMEIQFHQTASMASLISGSVGLLCTGAGVLASALVITYFKPGPRNIAAWNVIVEFLEVLGFILIIFINCGTFSLQGTPQPDGTLDLGVECNSNCSCPDSLPYSPVCDPRSGTTFFSACHAGCGVADWLTANTSAKTFSNCSCVVDGGVVIDGPCSFDCNGAFIFFIVVQCIQRFLSASGRAGNMLVQFRCVSPEDKSVAMAFAGSLVCGLAFIPGPVLFGILIDMTCIVWGRTCGETGNCWLYDLEKLRYYVNIPIIVCLLLGTLWDVGVWYYVKGLPIYDEDEELKGENATGGTKLRTAVALVAGS